MMVNSIAAPPRDQGRLADAEKLLIRSYKCVGFALALTMPVPASTAPAQDLRKPPAISAPTGYVAPGGAAARADVVGVRIGMTVDQAVRALKAHNDQMTFDNLRVTIDRLVTEPYIFAVVARNHDNAHEVKGDLFEEVVLRLALPPNPAVVTEILRVLSGRKGKNLSTDVVVAGLKDKYGGGFTRIRVGSLEDLYVWRLDGLPVEVKPGGCFYQGAPVNPTRRWSAMKQGGFKTEVQHLANPVRCEDDDEIQTAAA